MQATNNPMPSHSVLVRLIQPFHSCWFPVVSTLLPTLWVPRQGLACGARYCWFPVGMSDPAPLSPHFLFGHWFLSCSIPQIISTDLLLPSDIKNAWIFSRIIFIWFHMCTILVWDCVHVRSWHLAQRLINLGPDSLKWNLSQFFSLFELFS